MIEIPDLYALFCDHPVVTTDTRDCPAGSIFFALRGATFDGNAFAVKALEAGCAYAVVDDPAVGGDDRLLHVPDALAALQGLYNAPYSSSEVLKTSQTNKKAALMSGKSDLGRHLVDIFEVGTSPSLQTAGPQRFAALFW